MTTQEKFFETLTLAKRGDGEAIGVLLQEHRVYLTLLAKIQIGRRMQAKADPDDVVQEVFLDAHRQFAHFRGDTYEAIAAWLRSILAGQLAQLVRGYCATGARNLKLEISIEQELNASSAALASQLAGSQSSPSESFRKREEFRQLAEMLEQLPKEYRDVILYRMIESLSFVDIANRMERTGDSVQKLWVRGLKMLRELMNLSFQ